MTAQKIDDSGNGDSTQRVSRVPRRRRRMLLALPVAAAAAAGLAACGSSTTSSAGGSSSHPVATPAGVKTANVGGTTVLTNASGFTLYTFAPDTSTMSACNGSCTQAWPPVMPAAGSANAASFSTIQRSGGGTQLTFHGHPLYTFAGDHSAGQATGNGVNAFGGLWHEATASGSAAPVSSSSQGSAGGGY